MTPQMEDLIVKSHKSLVARSALALIAASSAFTIAACGAGQIAQTVSNRSSAVNGNSASLPSAGIELRDVNVVIDANNKGFLKFTAANTAQSHEDIKLTGVKVNGQTVALTGDTTIKANCNLVAGTPKDIEQIKSQSKEVCITYASPALSSIKDIFAGGSAETVFTFDKGELKLNAPVNAHHVVSGETYRGPDAGIVDQQQFEKGHNADHEGHGHEGHEGHGH